jgi:hypothetical protein
MDGNICAVYMFVRNIYIEGDGQSLGRSLMGGSICAVYIFARYIYCNIYIYNMMQYRIISIRYCISGYTLYIHNIL